MTQYDVIVIGAGFAGVIAARDLSTAGYSVLLLEGRDRIGGRTYTEDLLGTQLEMGGAYVHWTQSNIWHELERYNIPLGIPLEINKYFWYAEDAVQTGDMYDYGALAVPLMAQFFADARTQFPIPFEVNAVDTSAMEKESIADRLNSMNLSRHDRDIIEGILASLAYSYDQQGVSQLLFCVASYFGNWEAFFETASVWPIVGGTKRLLDCIMNESKAELRLSTPITAITDNGSHVTVTTQNSETIQAKAVLSALPINTLVDIIITPDVTPAARKMINEKNPVLSSKIWVKAKGEIEPFQALAPIGKNPINAARVDFYHAGNSFIMCLCSDSTAINPTDLKAVQSALATYIPDIEVLEAVSHDWVTDPFSQGAYMIHRPGNYTQGVVELRQPHGRIYFAGSDIAAFDPGAIEGAADSGASAARKIAAALA